MGPLKKKPKPFSAMKKSRRLMVFASLVLVMLGCFALYSAMQNEEWTQDEPTQRKVFLLASLLLITSIALCYYALNGELVEETEMLEAAHLTAIKFGDYSTIKPDSLVTYQQPQTINRGMEDRLLELLQPGNYEGTSINSERNIRTNEHYQQRNDQRSHMQEGRHVNNCTSRIDRETASVESRTVIPAKDKAERPLDNSEIINKSLIVELIPLLPLELCERELANINIPSLMESLNRPLASLDSRGQNSDLVNPFSSFNKTSDAG